MDRGLLERPRLVEVDRTCLVGHGLAWLARIRPHRRRRHRADGRNPPAHELDRLVGMSVGVEPLVELVETFDHRVRRARIEGPVGDRHVHLVGLPDIAQIGGSSQHATLPGDPVPRQRVTGLRFELGIERGKPIGGDAGASHDPGPNEVVADIGHHQSDGGEHPRLLRHQYGRNAGGAGEGRRVQRSGAPECDEGDVAGVESLLRGADPDRALHVRIGDADDSGRRLLEAQAERRPDPVHDCAPGGFEVELHLAAEESIGVQPAQHDVRVGNGRLGSAAPIRGGAGLGARALRPDVQAVSNIEPRDAARPCTDGVDLDHGQHDGMLRDAAFGGHAQLSAADQRDVGARAAHVHAEQIGPPAGLAETLHGERATGRPGGDEAHRKVPRRFDRQRAAVRLHQQHRGVREHGADTRRDLFEVPAHQRHGRGVQRHGAHSFELPDFPAYLVRRAHVDARQCLSQPVPDLGFVPGIHIRVQKADGDRLGAGVAKRLEDPMRCPMVGLRQDFAIGSDAFRHAQPPLARNDRQGLVLKQVVHVGSEVATDFEDVAKSFRRQQGRVAELVLEHCVGDEGGAVHEQSDVVRIDSRKLDATLDRGDQRTRGVAAATRYLGDGDLAGLLVQHRDIGEGAADVHPESYRAHRRAPR